MTWKAIEDHLTIEDIGARLLKNLAKGIYSHEAVLREYVQNAFDAILQGSPEKPEIKITIQNGDSIAIQDNGKGMTEVEIREAKKIAVSNKANQGLVGHKGIGIWAGFEACRELEVITTTVGVPHRYRLVIDFDEILKHADENINIKELLDGRFHIESEDEQASSHYTRVTLRGLKDVGALANETEVTRIISEVLPARLDPNFPFQKEVSQFLDGVEGYEEVPILLGGKEVFRSFSNGVTDLHTKTLERDGIEYARVWSCVNQQEKTFPGNSGGIRLRLRNFAVGGKNMYNDEDGRRFNLLRHQDLRSTAHVRWHVGEIHVTNSLIYPDTPRSSLEPDSNSRTAIEEIRGFYDDRIAYSRAISLYKKCRGVVQEAEVMATNPQLDLVKAKQALDALRKYEVQSTGNTPTAKDKRHLRELLRRTDSKKQRKDAIAHLKAAIEQAEGGLPMQQPSPALEPTPSSDPQALPSTPAIPNPSNGESLASDLIAVIEDKLQDDDEMVKEISEAILDILRRYELLEEEE